VVGLGWWGQKIVRDLADSAHVEVVLGIDPRDEGRAFAEQAGLDAGADLAEALADERVDAVVLCTPHKMHGDQIVAAAEAGRHVFCEKPLAASLRDADALIAAAGRSDHKVMPIFQYRFGHGLQKLRHLIASGLAGRAYLSTVETAWRRRAAYYDVPWRGKWATESGGALLGHAIHAHDMLTYALGPIRSVFCRAATLVNQIEVEDTAAAALEMADGSLATLSVTLGSPVEVTRHRLCFSGLVAESNTRPYSNSGEPWTFSADTPELQQRVDAALEAFVPLPEGYAGQFLRFHSAVREGGELPVTLADARASLELVTALYDSARRGQPVGLPIGTDHPLYASWLPG
jgi:predicted dehydrogenase